MYTKYDSHAAGGNTRQDGDLLSSELVSAAAEGSERVRVDWRLVLAYLASGIVALFLI